MVGGRGRIASQVSKGYHVNFWLLPTLYPFLGWLSWDWCLVFCNHACKCITQACFSFLVIPALNPLCQSPVLDRSSQWWDLLWPFLYVLHKEREVLSYTETCSCKGERDHLNANLLIQEIHSLNRSGSSGWLMQSAIYSHSSEITNFRKSNNLLYYVRIQCPTMYPQTFPSYCFS